MKSRAKIREFGSNDLQRHPPSHFKDRKGGRMNRCHTSCVGKIICMRLSSWFSLSLSHTYTATNKQPVTHGTLSSRVVVRSERGVNLQGAIFSFFILSFSGQEANTFMSMFPRGERNKTSLLHFDNTCRTSHLTSDTTVTGWAFPLQFSEDVVHLLVWTPGSPLLNLTD